MTANEQERIEHNQDKELRLKTILREIVERGVSVNSKDDQGEAALHLLMQYRGQYRLTNVSKVKTFDEAYKLPLNSRTALAITRLFLANGAEVDLSNRRGKTPLHIAVGYNSSMRASILLKHGADVNAADDKRMGPLHHARSAELAKLLLANGALVNAGDRQLRTPLHFAVESDYLEVVQILLQHGARVSFTDQDLKTPLHSAMSSQVAELLLANGAIVDARDKQGLTPLHVASESNLHEVMQVLLKFGADVNAKDERSRTALHRVVRSYSAEKDKKTRDTVRLLLKSGVNVNAENDEGYTAIQEAIRSLHEENTFALLEHNVEVFPRTARHQCIKYDGCGYSEKPRRIGRLIDASVKLRAAGISLTRYNLMELADNPRKEYFPCYINLEIGDETNKLKTECEAEVEKLKSHMVTDKLSLHDFMLTDIDRCKPSKSLLDTLQIIDYATYPTYDNFMISKFKRLKLMLFATDRFSMLLRYGGSQVRSLPEELVFKILVHLDSADMKNLISCTNNDI